MTSTQPPKGDALVLFGLTGDLGKKKLFPAIVELSQAGLLSGPVIGVGRSEHTDDDLWRMLSDATDVGRSDLPHLELSYLVGDSKQDRTYDKIAERIGDAQRPVVYAALPPELFGSVAAGISRSGLPENVRLIVEKPFGHDAASARKLFEEITDNISEDRLFAVDHFLAKSAVENLATFRNANPMISALFRSDTIKRIEVTMSESFGVDGRGSFYDSVGAIRDVVQNHLLQLVAVMLMGEPSDNTAESFNAARASMMASIEPLRLHETVLGQFDGYLDVDDVEEGSTTETFVATRLRFTDERWSGLEVVLRHGKEMTESYTEAIAVFADASDPGDKVCAANRIRFILKPDAAIAIEVATLDPESHGLRAEILWLNAPTDHGELGDYASMFAGALSGDHRHFARIDDIEAAWRVVDPILKMENPERPFVYSTKSMGPDQADEIVSTGCWIPGPATK